MSQATGAAGMLRHAVACFADGRLDEARTSCQEVLRLDNRSADAHHLWGALEMRCGRFDAAKDHIKTAIRLHPTRAEYHNTLGAVYASLKQFAQAIHYYWKALSLEPFYIEAHRNLALALGDLGEVEEQAQVLESISVLDSSAATDHAALLQTGRRLQQSGSSWDAVACFRRVLSEDPDNVNALRYLGQALWKIGDIVPAIAAFEKVVCLEEGDPEAIRNLSLLYLMAGQIDKGTRYLRKSLDISPNHAQAFLALAKSGHMTDDELRLLKSAAQGDSGPPRDLPMLHYALGEAFHARKDYVQAFSHFDAGNSLRRKQAAYDPKDTSARIDSLIAFFGQERFSAMGCRSAVASDRPIFIVGMPRSGTTLVEQILSAHPQVFAAGELDFLRRLTQRMALIAQPSTDFPGCLDGIPDGTLQKLAEDYINRLSRLAPNALRVTDKMPWNIHALGLIALMWPNAKIVHCMRDPMDTCFSCFRTYFAEDAHAYTCDLAELGHYYAQYRRLAEHWRCVLPVEMWEVQYEKLVEEPDIGTRSLVEFCGLPWDDRCLEFHASGRPSKTNPLEVRRPINAGSIGSWKKYETHLQPLQEALRAEMG